MRKFHRTELTRFLGCLDTHLSQPTELIMIGGAAASLAYGIDRTTTDIDITETTSGFEEALRLARQETGLNVPFQQVGIWDGPYCFEDRLEVVDLKLRKLRVLVPEKHDLALMKVVRGQENDRDAIRQIAGKMGLDEKTLVDRFTREMTHVIGNPAHLRDNFLVVIEMLYGEAAADRVEAALSAES